MTPAPLHLILTFDAEADVFDASIGANPDATAWRGIEEGIPLVLESLAAHTDANGGPLRATWFVRTDTGIATDTGDAAYLLRRHDPLWRARQAAGDEIAFHPHLSRRAQTESSGAEARAELHDAFAAVRGAGYQPVCSRIGEAFGSNATFEAIQELGVIADSTAMPGRVRRDADRLLDWTGTPTRPYRPSAGDYRVPGHPERPLWQIPMTTVPVRADYDAAPLSRYVDLSFHPAALREGLCAAVRTVSELVTVTHPSTIVPGVASRRHGLLSFDPDAFRRNLDQIFAECASLGRKVYALTMAEYARRHAASRSPALAA